MLSWNRSDEPAEADEGRVEEAAGVFKDTER